MNHLHCPRSSGCRQAFRTRGVFLGLALLLTAWGSPVAAQSPPFAVAGYVIEDANANGVVDPNECVSLDVILTNLTDVAIAGPVEAHLFVTPVGATVVGPVSVYSTIPAGGVATSTVPFRFQTAASFRCGQPLDFTIGLKAIDATASFPMPSGRPAQGVTRADNSTPLAVPDLGTVESTVSVGGILDPIGKVEVSLQLDHPYLSDLTLTLVGPDGTEVILADKVGGSGDRFGSSCADADRTVFDDEAAVPIAAGSSPFVGAFRPAASLTAAFGGKSGTGVNGVWRLRVTDNALYDVGTLGCWSLSVHRAECDDGGGTCTNIPQLCVSPSAIVFPVSGGGVAVEVQNCGQADLIINDIQLAGADPGAFTLRSTNNCIGVVLAPDQSCSFVVACLSPSPGTSAQLRILDNAPDSPQSVSLVVGTCPPIEMSIPTVFAFGIPLRLYFNFLDFFGATNGTPPYAFAVIDGALPPGLVLDPDGRIHGNASTLGEYEFTVEARDANNCTVTVPIATRVVCPPWVILPALLPSAQAGVLYSNQLEMAWMRQGQVTYTRVAGELPPGLELSTDGLIYGVTDGAAAGTYEFKVRVVGPNECPGGDKFYSIRVNCPFITAEPALLPIGEIFQAYSVQLMATGGTPPYSYAVTAGALPDGLTVSIGGLLSGTPTSIGSTFTVTITDANGCRRNVSYPLHLALPPPSLPPHLQQTNLMTGVAFRQNLIPVGGEPPVTLLVTGGSLPQGVTLTSDGVLTGIPTQAGPSTFTVTATDGIGRANSQTYTLGVAAGGGGNNNPPPAFVQFGTTRFVAARNGGTAVVTVTRRGELGKPSAVDCVAADQWGSERVAVAFGADQAVQRVRIPVRAATTALRLENPVQAGLGTTTTAQLSVVDSVSLTDRDGDVVTLRLTGPGSMTVNLADAGLALVDQLVLDGVTIKSKFTAKVRKAYTGDGLFQVGTIAVNGDLKSVTAAGCDLTGGGLSATGYLAGLSFHGLRNSAQVVAGGAADQTSKVKFALRDAGCYISMGSKIKWSSPSP